MRTEQHDRDMMDDDEIGDLAPQLDPKAALETVSRGVREHPYVAIAAAAGVGFLLGGGLGGRIFGAALSLGGRLAADALLASIMERDTQH